LIIKSFLISRDFKCLK